MCGSMWHLLLTTRPSSPVAMCVLVRVSRVRFADLLNLTLNYAVVLSKEMYLRSFMLTTEAQNVRRLV